MERRNFIKTGGLALLGTAVLPQILRAQMNNIFAADLLISDEELLSLIKERKTFDEIAKELYVPALLLCFKFRVLKKKGHKIEAPYTAESNFLKDVNYCIESNEI